MYKILIAASFIFLAIFAHGLSDKERMFPELSPGECASLPETKVYLPYLRSHQSGPFFQSVLTAIGPEKINSLQDSSSTNYYFCQIRCKSSTLGLRDEAESESTIWVLHSDAPMNFNNQNGFLCNNVSVELVPLVGDLKTLAPVVTPFSGFESNLPEIQKWFAANHFQMKSNASNESIEKFKGTMLLVGKSFLQSNSSAIISAGDELVKYSQWSDEGRILLKKRISELSKNKWAFQVDNTSKDYFLNLMLNQYGRFLEFMELN